VFGAEFVCNQSETQVGIGRFGRSVAFQRAKRLNLFRSRGKFVLDERGPDKGYVFPCRTADISPIFATANCAIEEENISIAAGSTSISNSDE
jgi:hypothetical protein